MAGAAIWASLLGLSNYLNDATVQSYLAVMHVPKSMIIAIAVLGLVTYVAAQKGKT